MQNQNLHFLVINRWKMLSNMWCENFQLWILVLIRLVLRVLIILSNLGFIIFEVSIIHLDLCFFHLVFFTTLFVYRTLVCLTILIDVELILRSEAIFFIDLLLSRKILFLIIFLAREDYEPGFSTPKMVLYCTKLISFYSPLILSALTSLSPVLWFKCFALFIFLVFIIHQEIQQFFDSIKGYHKRSQEVKDCYSIALQQRFFWISQCFYLLKSFHGIVWSSVIFSFISFSYIAFSASIHADRRRFLRSSLRELCLLMKDQPGLLGPKILFVWMGLSFSRDEVLYHIFKDRIILQFKEKYVNGYDSIVTRELISSLSELNEADAILLTDFAASISNINSDTDLRALRLDWFRFQARTSVTKSIFSLQKHRKLAVVMNTNVFHLKMIDLQDEMLKETSDLSIYWFVNLNVKPLMFIT
uniref:TIR domain-containing protein n=1 Tax=Heterorhabditis bacteriophora TaxID=37862 RepID=A0A1I7XEF1_HETBA